MFEVDKDKNQRNYTKKGGTIVYEPGPNWNALKTEAVRKGYRLNVYGPPAHPTVNEVLASLSTAEVTLFIGHGAGTAKGTKWISNELQLSDGMIRSPDGLYQGKWNANKLTPKDATPPAKVKTNRVTGLFTCNSDTELPTAFDIPSDSELITNDGGKDGMTRVGTLEQAAYDFIRRYMSSGGKVHQAMATAQATFTRKGARFASDDDGDTLHAHGPAGAGSPAPGAAPGASPAPPVPPRGAAPSPPPSGAPPGRTR